VSRGRTWSNVVISRCRRRLKWRCILVPILSCCKRRLHNALPSAWRFPALGNDQTDESYVGPEKMPNSRRRSASASFSSTTDVITLPVVTATREIGGLGVSELKNPCEPIDIKFGVNDYVGDTTPHAKNKKKCFFCEPKYCSRLESKLNNQFLCSLIYTISIPRHCIHRGIKMHKVSVFPHFTPKRPKMGVNRRFQAKHANFHIIKITDEIWYDDKYCPS